MEEQNWRTRRLGELRNKHFDKAKEFTLIEKNAHERKKIWREHRAKPVRLRYPQWAKDQCENINKK